MSKATLEIDDIFSDLASFEKANKDNGANFSELGRSLLPEKLQDGSSQNSQSVSSQETPALLDALCETSTEHRHLASQRLSEIYLDRVGNILHLNERDTGSSRQGSMPSSLTHFETLHHRVARLQAETEADIRRLEEVRKLIA